MDRCVNCLIATGRSNSIGRRVLEDEAILAVVRRWRASQPVSFYLFYIFFTYSNDNGRDGSPPAI